MICSTFESKSFHQKHFTGKKELKKSSIMANNKFVSIITVNYNGRKYLGGFLDSVFKIDYPTDKYEVIVVDNASTDRSVKFIKDNYPQTKIIESARNLGFGKGNNLAMAQARGELFFLVNNDTVLDKNCLSEIVKTFTKWSRTRKIGAVNAKMVLIDKYVPVKIEEAAFSGFSTPKEASGINVEPFLIPLETQTLFTESVFLPIKHSFNKPFYLKLDIKPFRKSEFKIYIKNRLVKKKKFVQIGQGEKVQLQLENSEKFTSDLIQNAGNYFFRDGCSRDRGSVVYKSQQFYEQDEGQYDNEEEIEGFCGAGVLLNKKALEEVGYFDSDFFMYYEDCELSLRMRAFNWKLIYSPKTVVRHIHSASSKEWSDFFNFQVERGRLLFVSKHWPRPMALWTWIVFVTYFTLAVPLYYLRTRHIEMAKQRFISRLKVNYSIALPFVRGLLQTKRLSLSELKKFS